MCGFVRWMLKLWGLHCLMRQEAEKEFLCPVGATWRISSCLRIVKGLLHGFLLYTIQADYSASRGFSLLCNVSQTLVAAATTGCLHVSICMCITLVQPLLYRRSIWMEPAARWRFTTSYEKAQWQDICLWRSSRQKGEPRGQRGPSGRTSVSRSSSWFQLKSQLNFREEGLLMSTAGRRRDTLPSLTSPPQGSIKSWLHGEAAKHQIICLMAGVADFLTDFCARCSP